MGVNYLRIKYLFHLLLRIKEKMSELRIKVIEPEAEAYTFDPIDTEPHCKIEDIRNFMQTKFPSFRNEDIELCYGGYTCEDSWETVANVRWVRGTKTVMNVKLKSPKKGWQDRIKSFFRCCKNK